MKALFYESFGGPEVLKLGELPDPHIGPDSVIVQVKAAGINPVDYKIRQGYLGGLIDTVFPVVTGWDVAGVVVAAGLDTPEFAVGDEVLAYARKDVVSGGTLAELASVPVRMLAHKPAGLSWEQAGALPLAGLTALQSVRRVAVSQGDRVLVHAASGGVGSFATQLAVLAGARVVGTAGPANQEYVRSLGAEPVLYGDALVDRAKALVPDGFDVILDYVGGQAMDTVPALLKPGGRVASIADPRVVQFGGRSVWVRPDADGLAELAGLVADGKLAVNIAAEYPLDQAIDAYRELEGGHVRGKLVVRV